MYKKLIFNILLVLIAKNSFAQIADTTIPTPKWVESVPVDSTPMLNMDALYRRPFLQSSTMPLAIGGYMEANTEYAQTDGVSAGGYAFQFKRMTLFFSSTVARKVKFLAEIEFEHGTKEINVETALADIEFHPILNLRAGIILNPIGSFNQNHDSPRWDFIDRPLVSTTLIPSTLSNVGFGLHGKYFARDWILGYEAYLTNGFDDQIITNTDNRTSLAAGKSNVEKFEKSNSGLPTFTGKLAIRNRIWGEIGFSCLSGVFNKWQQEGVILDKKRFVNLFAIDFNTSLLNNRLQITGEAAKGSVDVPETYTQNYGKTQMGVFIDVIGTVLKQKIFHWEKAQLNIGIRGEYVDYNQEKFRETGGNIGDVMWAIVPIIAFRPVTTTSLRFNYRYQQHQDLFGNPATKTGVFQFGLTSYF